MHLAAAFLSLCDESRREGSACGSRCHPWREPVADLTERLQREHDGQMKPRLPMLDRLAGCQARTRLEMTAPLGAHRHPLGRWLASMWQALPSYPYLIEAIHALGT
jgi:hypothetical protein